MDSTASCTFHTNGSHVIENAAIPTGAKEHSKRKLENFIDLTEEGPKFNLKRKLENFIDLTEDEDVDNCRVEKESQATAGASNKDFDKAVDGNGPFAQSEDIHASDDNVSRKKAKPNEAESAQTKREFVQEQLLFECGICRKAFKNITEFNDHDAKHKQPPPVQCRRCRKTFADIAERNHHFQTSSHHFCCRYCKHAVVEFGNANSLRYHYIDRHSELYCHFCDLHFPNTFQRFIHMAGGHWECAICRKIFHLYELCNNHCRICYSSRFGKRFPEAPNGDGNGEGLPDHYARLGISKHSSHEQVLKAAKEMRVKTHPDRLKRREGLREEEMRAIDVEAALVGEAADVLSDPELRYKYDCKIHA